MRTRRTPPFDQVVGGNLRGHRKKRGMSQVDLAHAIGVSYQQMHKYESGRNRLSLYRAILATHALDISTDDLIDGWKKDQPRKRQPGGPNGKATTT